MEKESRRCGFPVLSDEPIACTLAHAEKRVLVIEFLRRVYENKIEIGAIGMLKKVALTMLLMGGLPAVQAENWVHVERYSQPKISQSDPAPYDEYLDTDFINFEGKWTLIRTKRISDESANEFHGKLELSTWAISCREFKFGTKEFRLFFDDDGKNEKYSKVSSAADLDQLARSLPLRQVESVGMIFYAYACLGATPEMWAERIKTIGQKAD
jgi:hypothetical protein